MRKVLGYDPHVPEQLKKIQQWFGGVIKQPIDDQSRINPIAPSGTPILKEATKYITPSPTLEPYQRIELYNQQYWWRLLKTLHEIYPLVTRLFGYHDFNQIIGVPYLQKYPPHHWSLNHLGDKLPQWVQEEYTASDQDLIYDAARIDWAYNEGFYAASLPSADSEQSDPTELFSQKMSLQPHVYLFKLRYDMFSFREAFLEKEPEYWEENDFPEMDKGEYHFVLYRNHANRLVWEKIDAGEFHLLERFQSGSSIEQACEWLETEKGELYQQATENLHHWIQRWIINKWLSSKW